MDWIWILPHKKWKLLLTLYVKFKIGLELVNST